MTKFSQIPEGGFLRPTDSFKYQWIKIQEFFLEGYYFNIISTFNGAWSHCDPDEEVVHYPNAYVMDGED